MNRRAFVTGLGAVLAAPIGAGAQQAVAIRRVGFLCSSPCFPATEAILTELRMGLRELGWIEGRNLEIRIAEGAIEQLHVAATSLIQEHVDIILAPSNPHVIAVRQATSTVPIIVVYGLDPVAAGFVTSLSHPGGNVTGVTWDAGREALAKHFEYLKQLTPRARRYGVLWDPTFAGLRPYWREIDAAAGTVGVKISSFEASTPNDVAAAFHSIARASLDGIVVMGSALMSSQIKVIVSEIARLRVPAIYPDRRYMEAGGLISNGPNPFKSMRLAASYIDKILKGAAVADLPMQQPSPELVINLKTAKALGLTIPQSLLLRADQVIE